MNILLLKFYLYINRHKLTQVEIAVAEKLMAMSHSSAMLHYTLANEIAKLQRSYVPYADIWELCGGTTSIDAKKNVWSRSTQDMLLGKYVEQLALAIAMRRRTLANGTIETISLLVRIKGKK